MCGIVGYCGEQNAVDVVMEGLKKLEYRGYDSAGICTGAGEKLSLFKKKGKIKELKQSLPQGLKGSWGIGHTRWATHGGVTEINAHPHMSGNGKISIVHNGIIENYHSLKKNLEKKGVTFVSETDSEVLAHLIESIYDGDLTVAVGEALKLVEGTYGVLCIHSDHPETLVGARNGSPLVVGIGEGEMLIASDITALVPYTNKVIYLEDGELVTIGKNTWKTTDIGHNPITKKAEIIDWEIKEIELSEYSTYMEKEIREQPMSVLRAMTGRMDKVNSTAVLGGLNLTNRELLNVKRVKFIAAGTSYHAGLTGAYLIEELTRIPASAELASEFRYKNPIIEKNTLYFAISQSGETADTIHAVREIKRRGGIILGLCNVVGSTISRETDGGVYLHSGPEISVASTKAFTSQLTVIYLITLLLGRIRHMSSEAGREFLDNLQAVPDQIEGIFKQCDKIKRIAEKYCHNPSMMFLGRGINCPIAYEGALKLKEISYIHAEGYSSSEIKHGPLALIQKDFPCVFVAPADRQKSKLISNIREIKAREGKVLAIVTEQDQEIMDIVDDYIEIPKTDDDFYPFLAVIPLQLLAYYSAGALGYDVDKPRNLAKSVTVE